jgi:hypothetical protein
MSNLIINVLNNLIAVLVSIISKLTVNQVDVELEPVVNTRVIFTFDGIDAAIAARQADWTIDTSVEAPVEVIETVTEVSNFDDAAILAVLGLATAAAATPVEVVEEVVEIVTVLGIVYTITHMVGVDVSFSGRSISRFSDIEGYLFEGTDGTSDFLIRVQAPLSLANAREWMGRNNETRAFNTRVVVTPTRKF